MKIIALTVGFVIGGAAYLAFAFTLGGVLRKRRLELEDDEKVTWT